MDDGLTGPGPTIESQKAALQQARELAAVGNLDGMTNALYGSFIVDGLTARIERQWRYLSKEDAQDAVAEAIKALYEKLRRGELVRDIGDFLFKVSNNKASDRNRHQKSERTVPPEAFDAGLTSKGPFGVGSIYPELQANGLDRELLKMEALTHARRLLPRLGQANIIPVMAMIFDAVEQGIEDLPSALIGEALGISTNTASVLRRRGFRAARAARQRRGLVGF